MIDYSRYDGHTIAQEWICEVIESDGILDNPFIRDCDANLISDAPIILEALKASEARVRELEAKLEGRELSDDELYNIAT